MKTIKTMRALREAMLKGLPVIDHLGNTVTNESEVKATASGRLLYEFSVGEERVEGMSFMAAINHLHENPQDMIRRDDWRGDLALGVNILNGTVFYRYKRVVYTSKNAQDCALDLDFVMDDFLADDWYVVKGRK